MSRANEVRLSTVLVISTLVVIIRLVRALGKVGFKKGDYSP